MRFRSVIFTAIALAFVTTGIHATLGGQKSRDPLLGQTVVRGVVYAWDGDRIVPLDGAEITLWRDDDQIGRVDSDKDGTFLRSISAGSPIIVTIDRTGYVQGRIICGRGDDKELVIYPTLLPRALAKSKWQKNFERFFKE
jgi:hypothetical protein